MGRRVKKLRINNGPKFWELGFKEFYAVHGIARHKTLIGKRILNRVAESINLTLLERAHCMLSNANFLYHRHF